MNTVRTGGQNDIDVADSVNEFSASPLDGLNRNPWAAGLSRRSTAAVTETLTLVAAEHRIILMLAGGYILAGGALLTIAHRAWPFTIYSEPFAIAWAAFSVIWLGWQYVRSPRRFRRALVTTRLAGALLIAAVVVPTQITFQSLKQSFGPLIGFAADPYLHAIDVRLHGRMPWQWLAPLLARPRLVHTIDYLYFAWFSLILVFVMWASWTCDRVLRQRAITSFLLMWVLSGTLIAAMASSGGPCFYGDVVRAPSPYQPLLKRLDALNTDSAPLEARIAQRGLWRLAEQDRWGSFAGISAMPSLHVGIAVLYMIIASRRSRVLGLLLGLYAIVIAIGSVLLGWHYAIDGYSGALLAVLCWKLAGWLLSGRDADVARRVEAHIVARR